MKKGLLSVATIAVITLTLSFSNAGYNDCSPQHSSGPAAGYAGDPLGGNKTCNVTTCHTGPTPTSQTGWITSNIPAAGYSPGATYSIVATATRANHTRFGFQISPQNSSGTVLGTLVINDATNTRLSTGNNNYVEHTSAGTTGTTGFHLWKFNWTAPVNGSGSVTFYGAFNITNANNAASGDTIYRSTLVVSENTTGINTISSMSEAISVYPNPVTDNITVKYNLTEAARTEIKIVDLQGKTIEILLSENQGTGQHDNSFNLDQSKYAKGFYFVKVTTNGKMQIKKILIQ